MDTQKYQINVQIDGNLENSKIRFCVTALFKKVGMTMLDEITNHYNIILCKNFFQNDLN